DRCQSVRRRPKVHEPRPATCARVLLLCSSGAPRIPAVTALRLAYHRAFVRHTQIHTHLRRHLWHTSTLHPPTEVWRLSGYVSVIVHGFTRRLSRAIHREGLAIYYCPSRPSLWWEGSREGDAMFQEISAALGRGERSALVTVVRVSGAAPCAPG